MFKPARATLGSFQAPVATQASPAVDAASVGWPYRAVWLVVFFACLSLLCVAACLNPSPTGTATHRQLGLPPCGLLEKTGIPCPSCGMTTAFAWAAKGRLDRSFITQPAGAIMAILTACTVLISLYLAITGKDITRLLDDRLILRFIIGFGVVVVAAWAYKIVAVYHKFG